MVTPILRLGYRTATLPAALRTRRAGGEERIVSMIAWASLNSPRRSHILASSCAESILSSVRTRRFRCHGIPGRHSTGSPFVKKSLFHRADLKRISGCFAGQPAVRVAALATQPKQRGYDSAVSIG
jgi:hypothetical protein